ncbi:hypothetical protein [Methylobacterium gregans]|uniref:Transmembrane protein n=1 Tax=Methylobacterium gregans TaxID=374424 RepID=A0AA37MCU5_9HYPH|nr:hypothetical protein [Methylobacterium gregans]MDQ0520870.1 hypothetical protein [Methylobacterium gregans]GJD81437.1 hypothetical protein NBEOAGPD_4685 [Methylobacterium gregans]GLS53182.1 hypothetical protein GCM10007886_13650 [Methylobacterium gregans]
MRIAALIFGLGLFLATCVWFFYLVPLGCGMNTTGCKERFTVWSGLGLTHFWAPLLTALSAMAYGSGRS